MFLLNEREKFRFGVGGWVCAILVAFLLISGTSFADLSGGDVLVLVNANSPTSKYIAKMYRQYHPDIPESQVLELTDRNGYILKDSSGTVGTAADEILTRSEYNELIATPVRDYLSANNLVTQIKVIVTTAGMPYRIEDTDPAYANVIYPGGSNPSLVSANSDKIDAASVESELTCLFYGEQFGFENRMVNPYHGYRGSSVTLFERVLPCTKVMNWSWAINMGGISPRMEGILPMSWPTSYGTVDRSFHAGDMYLVCRLDGPKNEGGTAIFSVRSMLERAKRASSLAYGVDPLESVAVLDDCLAVSNLDQNRVYNLDGSVNYIVFNDAVNQPPDAPSVLIKDDFVNCYTSLTSSSLDYSALNTGSFVSGNDIGVLLDRRGGVRTKQADLNELVASIPGRSAEQNVIMLTGFGVNGDEGDEKGYLGQQGDALFDLANGAVFCSIESFNAVTMFSGVTTSQAKIIEFIGIGGSAAIGHAFEPMASSVIDSLYLFHNFLADDNGDGQADLTFVEAAYTAIPFLSWTEVVIGDPLMRITYGQGGDSWTKLSGDCNKDGVVNIKDVRELKMANGGDFYSSDPEKYDIYNDLCDFNDDGKVNIKDVRDLKLALYQ